MKLPSRAIILIALAGLASAALSVDWPKIVTSKTLYADNDYRGKKAPDFFVQKWLNANEVDTRGKVVVVDFWATWCPPCRATIPELNEIAKKFKDKVVVIGISDEKEETVADFMKKTEMDYNVGIDPTRKMSKQIGVKGIPHVLVISPDGIVRWQGFPLDNSDRLTDAVIQQVVDQSAAK